MSRARKTPGESAAPRALARLLGHDCVLAPVPRWKGFGVYRGADRRRRPLIRISDAQVKTLLAEGAIAPVGEAFVLTPAGRARAAREAAHAEEAFLAQHRPVLARIVIDANGALRPVRGHAPHGALGRLEALRDGKGARLLTRGEIAAAHRLRAAWEAGQRGLVSASDWTSPPRGASASGQRNGREAALSIGMDARAAFEAMLAPLDARLRRAVIGLCIEEMSLEALERAERWPARRAKTALKRALAQIAAA